MFLGTEQIEARQPELPISVALFGGLDGQDLQHLAGLRVLVDMGSILRGVEAFYSDGRSPVRLGIFEANVSPETHEFRIAGLGGERIHSIDAFYTPPNHLLAGLRVISPHTPSGGG
jgi:hypothetical protein